MWRLCEDDGQWQSHSDAGNMRQGVIASEPMLPNTRVSRATNTFTTRHPQPPELDTMDEEEETELRNPFPSPPSHYSNYTSHNLKLLALLHERQAEDISETPNDQKQVLADQSDVPDWPLTQLEKPRVDWILEEGHYNVFGDTWFVSV